MNNIETKEYNKDRDINRKLEELDAKINMFEWREKLKEECIKRSFDRLLNVKHAENSNNVSLPTIQENSLESLVSAIDQWPDVKKTTEELLLEWLEKNSNLPNIKVSYIDPEGKDIFMEYAIEADIDSKKWTPKLKLNPLAWKKDNISFIQQERGESKYEIKSKLDFEKNERSLYYGIA